MIWVARHVAMIAVGRVLQGFASAAIWSVGLALLVDTIKSEEVSTVMCSGTIVGPMVGGFLYSVGGFDSIMGFAVSLLAIDVALRCLMIEKKTLDGLLTDSVNHDICMEKITSTTA
jgi:MFS family permease